MNGPHCHLHRQNATTVKSSNCLKENALMKRIIIGSSVLLFLTIKVTFVTVLMLGAGAATVAVFKAGCLCPIVRGQSPQ